MDITLHFSWKVIFVRKGKVFECIFDEWMFLSVSN